MVRIIEGNWDDLVTRDDLRGLQVRITVLEDAPMKEPAETWLARLEAWAHSHKPVGHFVDDSRDSIYTGTLDDPR
jgi:hypothetical protein